MFLLLLCPHRVLIFFFFYKQQSLDFLFIFLILFIHKLISADEARGLLRLIICRGCDFCHTGPLPFRAGQLCRL